MSLVFFVAIFGAACLPAAAVSAETCATESCAAQGVILLQQRPGEFIPSQRGSPLAESHQALQMALDQSKALNQFALQNQRTLDQIAPSATALVQESPKAVVSPPALSQMTPAASPPVQAAPAKALVSAGGPSAGAAAQTIAGGTQPHMPATQPQAAAAHLNAGVAAPAAASAPVLAAQPQVPATQPQAAAVQATQGAALPAQAGIAHGTLEAKAASAINRQALSDMGDEKQEYDKAGYEKDFDTEWKEHKHSVYKIGTTTEAPHSGAPLRVSLPSAVAVAAVGLALL